VSDGMVPLAGLEPARPCGHLILSLVIRNSPEWPEFSGGGALAQETRLEIFRHLVRVGPEGVSAGAIADFLSVPGPTLSFHLQQLVHAGLVTKRRESRSLIYAIDIGRTNGLLSFLMEDCCSGRPELCQLGHTCEVAVIEPS
jgi:ArsR family transcriptional regulator, arsenate/arsenite/antimonite-responsive transcriptional repressor